MPSQSIDDLQTFQTHGFRLWLLWFGLVLAASTLAATQSDELRWRYLVDEAGTLAATPALWSSRITEWRELDSSTMSFGLNRAAYWLHAKLPAQLPEAALLVIGNPRLDDVEVYKYRDGLLQQSFQLGDLRPFQDRLWPNRLFVVPLQADDASAHVLLRIQSKGLLRAPLQLLAAREFNQQQQQVQAIWAWAYGALFLLVLMHGVAFWIQGHWQHVKALVLLLLIGLFQAYVAGFAYPLLWSESPWWQNQIGPALVVLTAAAISLFALDLMHAPAGRERWRKFARSWAMLCGVMFVAAMALPTWLGLRMAVLFGLTAFLLAIAPLARPRGQTAPARRLVVGAWLILWLSFGLAMAGELGFLGSKPWTWNMHLLPVLGLIPLSLSLLLYGPIKQMHLLQRQAHVIHRLRRARQRSIKQAQALRLTQQKLRATRREVEQLRLELAMVDDSSNTPLLASRTMFDRGFRIEWQRAYREHRMLSLILCQVDQYDSLISKFSESFAERCVRAVAATLQAQFQRPTDLVARFAPGVLAILAAGATQTAAHRLMEQARQRLALELDTQKEPGGLTLSVGIASLVPDERHHQAVLLSFADDALHRARLAGGNCSICYQLPRPLEEGG